MSANHMTAYRCPVYSQQQDAAELRRLATPPMLRSMAEIPDKRPTLTLDGVVHGPECDKTMYGTLAAANVLCTCDHPPPTRAEPPPGLQVLTPEQCMDRWQAGSRGEQLPHGLTASQVDAASAHWSVLLRAKVAESEAERRAREPSVVIEHDADDLPWRTW